MAIFLANEIHSTGGGGGDITGLKAHVQILFSLKDNKCRAFEDIFSGTNKQSKEVKFCVI